jgi:SAM-dependent methyltransferase
MSTPWPDIAHTYDVAAEHYAATFAAELDGKPFDRGLLDRYAAALAGHGEVWDLGSGAAGHLTRYLADRGVTASGADISPGSVAVARQCQPGLTFRVADMCELPAGTASLAGIVAFYSMIHLPRVRIPVALAEFRRVLAPGGALLAAMHGGTGETGSDAAFGLPVQVRATLVVLDEISAMAESAGLTVRERHERAPYPGEYPSPRLYLWAEVPLPG